MSFKLYLYRNYSINIDVLKAPEDFDDAPQDNDFVAESVFPVLPSY